MPLEDMDSVILGVVLVGLLFFLGRAVIVLSAVEHLNGENQRLKYQLQTEALECQIEEQPCSCP